MELLGATRAETSGLARCHGAADELQNACVCAKDRVAGVFKADIIERTMAIVSQAGARCGIVGDWYRRVDLYIPYGIRGTGGPPVRCGLSYWVY